MALEGKIVDFGVADILQLISQQQKMGVLIVEKGKDSFEIVFWNGMIINTHPTTAIDKELLGRKLVKAGLISEQQLKRALEIQEENYNYLGEILVDLEILSKEKLEQIIHNQIYDILSELFQWEEGSYTFHPQPVVFNEKIFSPLGLEHILLDVLRMIDEWPDVVKRIRSMDTVFRKSDRRLSEGLENDISPEKMSQEQTKVYNLVNGQNSVQDIADISLLDRFSTSKSLVELLDGAYIEVVHKDKLVNIDNKRVNYILIERTLTISSYVILAILIIFLMILSPPDMKSTFSLFVNDRNSHLSAITYLENNRLLRIKNALYIYLLEERKYPEDLKELVSADIISEEDIRNIRGELYPYRSKGNSYQLQQKYEITKVRKNTKK